MKKIFAIILLIIAATGVYYLIALKDKSQPIATPVKGTNSNTFTSSTLGVSFSYLSKQPGGDINISVKETKNRICVTYDVNDNNCKKGQFVEVFKKEPSESLSEAIKKQFLSNYSPSDCFVSASSPYPSKMAYQGAYETAVISFPKTENSDAPWWQNADKCPAVYTMTNGLAYFLADKVHPDKFLFFNIGQYAILSPEKDKTWDQTIVINY